MPLALKFSFRDAYKSKILYYKPITECQGGLLWAGTPPETIGASFQAELTRIQIE